jgi:L-threonylcarbamoyladenylate synthase
MAPMCLSQSDPQLPGAFAELLETGGVAIFPTDTVYGLGGNPWDERALDRVRRLKGRSADQPFTLHLPTLDSVERFAVLDDPLRRTVDLLLPGPVTLLLPAAHDAPGAATRDGKVGIRVPKHGFFSETLAALGGTLFGTSVNRAGALPLTSLEAMIEAFSSVDLIIEGKEGSGLPSAILDLTVDPPRVLRGSLPAILHSVLEPHDPWTDQPAGGDPSPRP